MSYQYDQYLIQHKENVKKGFGWIQDNIPELTKLCGLEYQICEMHDDSKMKSDEYVAYDRCFYGDGANLEEFNKAFLLHIHRNPHHWQYWILINDDANHGEGKVLVEMPYNYILEMVCDWWAFSWAKGDLTEMFKWYEQRKDYIQLHDNSRLVLEDILNSIEVKLKE